MIKMSPDSKRECIECGEEFSPKEYHQAFCSEKCKDNSFDWYISMEETYLELNKKNEILTDRPE